MTQFPGQPIDPQGTDLSAPLTTLLNGLCLLGTQAQLDASDGATAVFTGPAQSVAIIEAGATALSKWWTAGLGATLGGGAIFAAVKGFWADQQDGVHVALIASAAFLFAALAVSIAVIVSGDVRTRGHGAAAMIGARRDIAITWLKLSRSAAACAPNPGNVALVNALVALVASGRVVNVTLSQGGGGPATGVRFDAQQRVEFEVNGAYWVPSGQVESLTT